MTPADRESWLERTSETVVAPELAVFDPHHHLWDYPGSRYLIEEFLADVGGGHRLTGTVYVECQQFYESEGPEPFRPVGETRCIDGLAGMRELDAGPVEVAAGIVGFADLARGQASQAVLEAHAEASPRFRGVRHATAWHENEKVHNAHTRPPPGLMADNCFRQGVACLASMGLSFDAWLYHPQLPELADLARTFPDLTIVLNHMAGPLGIGPYDGRRDAVFDAWLTGMADVAACENVFVKLGGRAMTSAGFGWHRMDAPPDSDRLAGAMKPYVQTCVDLFGPARCMFESNFPVDRASCSYTVLWNAFKKLSSEYSPSEQRELLHDTATRVYRVEPEVGARQGGAQ
ncbi:amidohydrolase family protein [Elongatibacter sediminis]|uniref:Amidohydrolase family protein n=1 Tax=Elongatibacter sediminis TaxID=3119006 RepID=A0AAW9RM66_9GAMM